MAMATANRARDVDVVIFGQTNAPVRIRCGASVLQGVDTIVRSVGAVGHATYGHTAIAKWFNARRHRRVVMFTDDQQHASGRVRLDHVPLIYTFNLAGYRTVLAPGGRARPLHAGRLHRRHVRGDGRARARAERRLAVLTIDRRAGGCRARFRGTGPCRVAPPAAR